MKNYTDILLRCPLFENIQESDLNIMLKCLGAKIEFFDKKYTIFAENKPAKYIGIILSGSAQIVQIDYYGNRNILSGVEPSEVFGEAFACANIDVTPVAIIANEPCEVLLIECSRILHTCSKHCGFHQQLIYNLMKELAVKNILFYQKIDITSKRTTREKLMTYLLYQSKKYGKNSFSIPFDRQELSDYLEVERSGLSAEISKLRKEGILESKKNHFKLL